MDEEKKIRTILEKRIEAIKTKDIEKAVSFYSENVLMFDVVGELQQSGKEALRNRLGDWFDTMTDDVDFEISDVKIEASAEITYCSSLNHINAILKDERKLDMWWRETLGCRKINSEWQITHSHSSVPFNPQSGKPSLDLKP